MNTYKRHRFRLAPHPISSVTQSGSTIDSTSAIAGVPDKLRSYGVARRELMPDVTHDNARYTNNLAEQSHETTRVRERGMRGPTFRKFKSVKQAQRFLTARAAVLNLFNLGRHKVGAQHYRELRISAFAECSRAAA
jgi:putative transposase